MSIAALSVSISNSVCALVDRVAFVLEPTRELARRHVHVDARQNHFDRHVRRLRRELAGGFDDVGDLRSRRLLEDRAVGNRRFRAAEPNDRSVEEIEGLALGDRGADLGPDSQALHALVDAHQSRGLLHAVADRADVERAQRAQIDHFGVHAALGERRRRLQRAHRHQPGGDDRQVGARPDDLRLVERHGVIAFRHGPFVL